MQVFFNATLNHDKSRQSRDVDIEYSVVASAVVRHAPGTFYDRSEVMVEDLEIQSVSKMSISWSKAAGYREMTEDHEGQNPDQIAYLNFQLSDCRDDWFEILVKAALDEYEDIHVPTPQPRISFSPVLRRIGYHDLAATA